MTFPVDQRHAAIELQVGLARNDRQVSKRGSLVQVRHVQQVIGADRGRAYRHLARAFNKIGRKVILRLEPLAALVDQADEGDRTAAELSGELGQRILGKLQCRIEHLIEPQRAESIGLILGHGLGHGSSFGLGPELDNLVW